MRHFRNFLFRQFASIKIERYRISWYNGNCKLIVIGRRSNDFLGHVSVAKGGLFSAAWPWPVSHYISKRIDAAAASKSRRRSSYEARSERVGSEPAGEHPDKVRHEPARCSSYAADARTPPLLFFSRPPPRRWTSLCSRRKDARRLLRDDQAR